MSGALDFTNFKLNVLGCELKPTVAESDIYTFCSGGDSTPPPQKPSSQSIEEGVAADPVPPEDKPPSTFAEPTKSQRDLEYDADDTKRVKNEQRAKSIEAQESSGPAPNNDLLWGNTDQGVSQSIPDNETPAEREARIRKKIGDARYEEIQRRRAAAIRAGQEGG